MINEGEMKESKNERKRKRNEIWRCFGSFESLMLLGREGKNTHSTANSAEDDERNRNEKKYYIANNK